MKEAVPAAAVIAFLVNPSGPSAEIYVKEVPATVRALGIQIPVLNASTEHDLDEAFGGQRDVDGAIDQIVNFLAEGRATAGNCRPMR